jgi:hypothetical protein
LAPATITGTVLSDADANGIQDHGEKGLSGVQVYADLANYGVFYAGYPTATTDAAGAYTLSGLTADTYIIRQVPPKGMIQTTPAPGFGRHVTVFAGATVPGQSFGDK